MEENQSLQGSEWESRAELCCSEMKPSLGIISEFLGICILQQDAVPLEKPILLTLETCNM